MILFNRRCPYFIGILSHYKDENVVIVAESALIGYEQVTFLIHGFNVDEQAGRGSLSRLSKDLASEGSAIVFVLWPGDSPIGPLSYPFTEGYQADDTAVQLARFIEDHISDAIPVNFVAHSLGCRVTLETIQKLHKMAGGDRDTYPVNQVCLLAAAADDHSLSRPKKYKAAAERTQRVVVLSSVEDTVLKFLYPAGDLLQAFIFFWRESFGFALGYHGPKAIKSRHKVTNRATRKKKTHNVATNVSSIKIDKKHEVDHGDYLPPGDDGKDPNVKQAAAAKLARAVLAGECKLVYQI
jgi:pimeloyl-ACP methyl ester carboxylesterase